MSTVDTDVLVASLERRLARLEALCLGAPKKPMPVKQALTLYIEATRLIGADVLPVDAVRGWSQALLMLDEVVLFELGRECGDPNPWVPFLQLLGTLRDAGHGADVAAAEAHLREVAANMLRAKGLSLVSPDDLLAREPLGPTALDA